MEDEPQQETESKNDIVENLQQAPSAQGQGLPLDDII